MKRNCWEVMNCERCTSAIGDDSCPVCRESKLHGVHEGLNGGRACWTIPHTKCGGVTQGRFGDKFRNCMECDFYRLVKREEKGSFRLSATILSQLER
ncbi:MAG: hypothetical protein HZB33_02320 [Nitrospirae bacterium]|nr:hypothetical protein [Nitrospirota bacterium]